MKVGGALFAAIVLALGLLAHIAAPPVAFSQVEIPGPSPKPGPLAQRQLESPRELAPRAPVKIEQLTPGQFDSLSDDQVIEFKDQRITARELRAKTRQALAEVEAKSKANAAQAKARFEAYRAKFLLEQKAKLDARNAEVRAEFARRRQQSGVIVGTLGHAARFDAIRNEARQLLERSKTASPAEQAQLEQRAEQLLGQLEQMGHVVRDPVQGFRPARPLPRRSAPSGR